MMFVTSDLHLGHQKEFLWRPRGFDSSEEHDAEIIRRWNTVVGPGDQVWVLGDIMLGDVEHGLECLRQLNGFIHIIRGNHDSENKLDFYRQVPSVQLNIPFAQLLKINGYRFYLSHYPTLCGNYDGKFLKQKTINLHGHTHSKDRFDNYSDKGICYNVNLDAHDCYPITIGYILNDIKEHERTLKIEEGEMKE